MAKPVSPEEYIASLPPERQTAIRAVRDVILKNLNKGFQESVAWGMLTYCVPLSRYPDTYNGQPLGIAALASQKSHMALYLMCVYGDENERERFEKAYQASGKRLDMGKSCVRFKKLEDLPLDVVGDAISRFTVDGFIAGYEAARAQTAAGKRSAAKQAEEPTAAKAKAAAKAPAAKKPAAAKAAAKKAKETPAAKKPAVAKAAAKKPAAAKAAAKKPAVKKPAAR